MSVATPARFISATVASGLIPSSSRCAVEDFSNKRMTSGTSCRHPPRAGCAQASIAPTPMPRAPSFGLLMLEKERVQRCGDVVTPNARAHRHRANEANEGTPAPRSGAGASGGTPGWASRLLASLHSRQWQAFHDLDRIAGEDHEMRVPHKEFRGSFVGLSLDDYKSGDVVLYVLDPLWRCTLGLAQRCSIVHDGRLIDRSPFHPGLDPGLLSFLLLFLIHCLPPGLLERRFGAEV